MWFFFNISSGIIRTIAVFQAHIDGLVQERRNSSALAMELRLSCTNPSICRTELHSELRDAKWNRGCCHGNRSHNYTSGKLLMESRIWWDEVNEDKKAN